jgi:hypothetical protein
LYAENVVLRGSFILNDEDYNAGITTKKINRLSKNYFED